MSIVVTNAPTIEPIGQQIRVSGKRHEREIADEARAAGHAYGGRETPSCCASRPADIQPDSDRQIPTSPPTSTRGKRRFQIRRRAVLSSSTKSALATSETENFTLPMPVQIKSRKHRQQSEQGDDAKHGPFFSSPEVETAVLLIFSAGTPPPPPSPRKALSRRDVRATASAFQSARPKDVPFRPPESAAARRSGAGRCCPGKDNALKAGCSRRPAPPRARDTSEACLESRATPSVPITMRFLPRIRRISSMVSSSAVPWLHQ